MARCGGHPRAGALLEAEVADAEFVGAEVVREFVAHGDGDLFLEEIGVVAEVSPEGVAVDDDAVWHVVASGGAALVEAVGVGFGTAVADDDGEVFEGSVEEIWKVVEGVGDDLLELVVSVGVEGEEFVLVGVDVEAVGGEAFGAADDIFEVVFADGFQPA